MLAVSCNYYVKERSKNKHKKWTNEIVSSSSIFNTTFPCCLNFLVKAYLLVYPIFGSSFNILE